MNAKEIYTQLWSTDYTRSQCAKPLAQHIIATAHKNTRLLDIGCGDGTTVKILRDRGFDAYGVDITMAGVNKKFPDELTTHFYELSATDMHLFSDNQFDYTFSTDCLEHLSPEDVMLAIKEIGRITRVKTFHVMPIWGDERLGMDLHLTQKDPAWWDNMFKSIITKNIEIKIMGREQFLKEMRHGQ